MGTCPYCRGPLAKTAAFCPACGQELVGYGRLLRGGREPTTPEFWERAHHLGSPARRVMIAVLACILAGAPLSFLFDDAGAGQMLVFDVIFAGAILLCAAPERHAMARLVSRWPPGWILLGSAAAVVLPLVAMLYVSMLESVSGLELTGGYFEDVPAWVLVLSICIVPGIFEELAFRGLMFGSLLHIVSRRNAHLITAALFAAVHFSPLIFPYHLLIGLLLGWLRVRSGSLTAPMAAHAFHNAAVVFLWES